jgi:tetratricopeptide (TPR) repeat protein
VAATAPKQAYSREEMRRLLDISERQLRSWEKQRLVASSEAYGFRELVALRTLAKLRRDRVPPARIRQALAAIAQKLRHVENPLTELRLYKDGKRIRVEAEGRAMEAISGQLLLDFDRDELKRLVEIPGREPGPAEQRKQVERRKEAEHWFQRALDLEQSGAPLEDVIAAYQKTLELDAQSAGALVNLGTVYFNTRQWEQAERYYRAALQADPVYPLAHFDLANLYDERGERDKAREHYEAALRIAPHYADAHYNLALLYQGSNQAMKAVHHWTRYLKLDPTSHWSQIARKELDKLLKSTVLPGSRG